MALSVNQTSAVKRLIRPGMRVASMGYPDVIAPPDMLCLSETFGSLEYRKDSEEICKRHGLRYRQIPDAHSFFKLLGAELDVYDVVKERGCEIFLDLNLSEREPFRIPQYDMVLDVGTAEHCFNIGQALINMASMIKIGGWIVHENPANWGNHGLYNLNPTLFYDFYTDNGFEVHDLKLTTRDGRIFQVPPVQRFKFPNEEVNILCLAKRLSVQPFVFPVQSKYKHLIPAAGVSGVQDAAERAKGDKNG